MRGRAEPRRWTLLPPLAPEAAATLLAPPRLSAEAAGVVSLALGAARTALPVTIVAPADASRLAIARALHAAAGRPGPLVAAGGRRPRLDLLPARATLVVDPRALAPETRLVLEALLDDGAVWCLASLPPDTEPPPGLAARLAGVVLRVPPLRQRPRDAAALADAALAAVAARLGRELAFTAGARARLARHAWPGDVPELDTVVARAALAAPDRLVGEEHLGLDAAPETEAAPGAELELVLAELAHELRNPLVTIKTFADHLPDLLKDAELRARFAALTGEAIERMDGLLENLLAYARLRAPRSAPVAVQPILDRILAEVEPELAGREVHVRREGDGDVRCAADAEHVAYALRNVVAGVVREVPPRDELVLETAVNGAVTIRLGSSGAAGGRLRRLVVPNGGATIGDPTLLPLSFRLARGVLERNGGGLALEERPDAGTTLVVQLPATEEERR